MSNYLQDVIRAIGSGAVTGADALGYCHPPVEPQQPAYNILPTSNAVDELTRKRGSGPAY